MTPIDLALADDHLRRAAEASQPYASFDWAWKAFNVLYSGGHDATQKRNREVDLIRRAVRRVTSEAPAFFNEDALGPLTRIDPVFDEKTWRQAGNSVDPSKHNHVRNLLVECRRRLPAGEETEALAEALYVIRCNLAHGFKTPEGPRDREVLAAAAPVLLNLVQRVRASLGRRATP